MAHKEVEEYEAGAGEDHHHDAVDHHHDDGHAHDPSHHQAPWVTVVTLLACFGFVSFVLVLKYVVLAEAPPEAPSGVEAEYQQTKTEAERLEVPEEAREGQGAPVVVEE